ncbi:MAG: inorganic diphosphatase [Oscillospiraceae bacterium]|nr:inorganic diphosphatase [Oscillospiraceae bacterium]
MNIWHDISPSRITPESFYAVIEITKGSKNKYELDKETGMMRLDRILYTSTHYPANYGFIPRTYAEDEDPLDVLVLCSEPIIPASLVHCTPIGVLSMIDEGSVDHKIIAVPAHDPVYNGYQSIADLPKHISDEIKHFFSVYKTLEGKVTAIEAVTGADKAIEIIAHDIAVYQKKRLAGDFDRIRADDYYGA